MGLSCATPSNRACAEPWAITPKLGFAGEYSSNPLLRNTDFAAEDHVASLIDLPLTYDTDGLDFSLRPNGRLSDSRGYSSLASNYVHVDSALQVTQDRQSFSLQSNLAREASLYDIGSASAGAGVRRDSEALSGDWTRALSERTTLQFDGSWSRLLYDRPSGDLGALAGLVDYKYWSAGPTLSYAVTELTSVNLNGSASDYASLDGITNSRSQSLQAGFISQLTELWQLTASAGYSRTQDRQKVFLGPYYLGTEQSNPSSAVYVLNLARQGETVNLSASASRSLQPVGVSFLSRRDSVTFNARYNLDERWDFAAGGAWERDAELVVGQAVANRRYLTAQLAANWHWTEKWTVSLQATRAALTFGPPRYDAGANGVNLNFSRQFARTDL